jgi:hypothetical protein
LKPANGARPHPKTGDAKVLINTSGKVVNGTAGKAVHKVFTVPASTRAPAAVLGEARPLPVMQQPPQPAQAQAAVTPAVASAAAARPAVAPAAASAAQLPSLQDVCAAMVQPAPARAAAGASTTPAAANGTAPSALSAVAATASSCAASVLGWAGERAHRVVHAYARAVGAHLPRAARHTRRRVLMWSQLHAARHQRKTPPLTSVYVCTHTLLRCRTQRRSTSQQARRWAWRRALRPSCLRASGQPCSAAASKQPWRVRAVARHTSGDGRVPDAHHQTGRASLAQPP